MMKNTDIEAIAIEFLNGHPSSNWNATFENIKKKYPGSDIKDFHKILKVYGELTGGGEAIWAHNATPTDVRDNNKTMGNKPNAKFWSSWRLFKEGKWTTGKNILTLDDFIPYFEADKTIKLKQRIAKGVATLLASSEQLESASDAFELVTDKGKIKMPDCEYEEIAKTFSKISGNKLGTEATVKRLAKKEAALKTVHNWSAAQTITHLKSIVGKQPDVLFWTAIDLRREGQHIGKIPGNLFNKVFLKQPSINIVQAKGMSM